MMAESKTQDPATHESVPFFLRDVWYVGALARDVGLRRMCHVLVLGEPIVIGRMGNGAVFAFRDICPHRGVPLSAGRIRTDHTVECAYHGWRFGRDGQCAAIPSLVEGQDLDPTRIRVRSYPVRERDGLIWIYMPAEGHEARQPRVEPPQVPVRVAKPRFIERQDFPCGIDHAVIGLMDPAHGPYVHSHWWWRRAPRLKEKDYAPLPLGFVMSRHAPTKPVYKLLGASVTTEITFELPSIRFETIRGRFLGAEVEIVLLTVCTPRTEHQTEVIQVIYWPSWLGFVKPFFALLGPTFLGDDRKIVELQQQGLKFNPRLMLIQDADVPAMWYHRLKRAWSSSVETDTPFANPIQKTTLRWRS